MGQNWSINQNRTKDHLNCMVAGDGGVGKTSLIIRYHDKKYPIEYVPTTQTETTTIDVRDRTRPMTIHDLPGQSLTDDYDRLRYYIFSQMDIFLVCFCVVDSKSLDGVINKWVLNIKELSPGTPFILVGTKIDLRDDCETKDPKDIISTEDGQRWAERMNAVCYVECSALTEKGVRSIFEEEMPAVLEKSPKLRQKDRSSCQIS